jgi:hypothetical protein
MFDTPFSKGQWADANNLKDVKPTSNWLPVFQGTNIHGVWLFASDNITLLSYQMTVLNNLFGTDITVLYTLKAAARPAPNTGKESKSFCTIEATHVADSYAQCLVGWMVLANQLSLDSSHPGRASK